LLTHGLTRHGYSKGIVGGQSFQFIRKLCDLAAYLSVRDVILATLEVVPPHYFGNSYVVVPLPLIEADLTQQLFLMMLELPHDFDWGVVVCGRRTLADTPEQEAFPPAETTD